MVSPCELVSGQSIAQVALPGTRPVTCVCAPQNDLDISLKRKRIYHLAVQNHYC
jgi:hypothetical protein